MSSIAGFSFLHGWLWLKSFPNVPLQSMHQFNPQVNRNIMMIVLQTIDPFFSDLHARNSQEHRSMPKGARLRLANLFSTSRDTYSRSMMEKLQAKEKD
jgi:hypothetical protein